MYRLILEWSEVWAILIPLLILLLKHNNSASLTPIVWYLICALILNLTADLIRWHSWHNPKVSGFLKYNNWLYNCHSIVKTILFVLFFKYAGNSSKWFNSKWIIITFLLFVILNFLFFDNFFYISSHLFTVEGIVLLICCVSFFLRRLQDEELYIEFDPPLIIATGLTIYEGINFFIFLFFNVLMKKEKGFAITIWDVHNISFIIFCVFIAYAFYGRKNINRNFNQSSHLRNPISNIS